MFGKCCRGVGDGASSSAALDLVGLGEDDLVADGGLVERLEDVEIDVLQAVAGVDQHIDPRQVLRPCRNLWISAVQEATFALGAEA